ncbi:diguanylate cyclase [Alcanivorax sp. NBRC 101098]|uniref:sensor domain-containing diguanylate cyclase n=1 Tax=Alcanivorax sp. NBRC 101098 TaxID=1113728 RepID=UPI00130E7B75
MGLASLTGGGLNHVRVDSALGEPVSVLQFARFITGIGSHYVWQQSAWMQKNGFALGVNLSFFTAALFFREFLDLKSYTRVITIAWYIITIYWALGLISLIGFGWFPGFALESSLLSCICAVIGTVWLLALGNISARYYAVAWGALLVCTMFTILMVAGILPYNDITEYSQMVGFLIEMLLLSIALAARINRERTQRELQQKNMLKLQMEINRERDNKIQAQEHILKLEKEAKQELEYRVQERTLELQKAMHDLQSANNEMARLTVTDSLTLLHNRRYFDEILEKELIRSNRSQQPVSLILIDIDHFKQFNDNYGHLVGDECLRAVALALKNEISRKSDLAARYGGEEFAVILPDTNGSQAITVAENIRNTIQNLVFKHQDLRIPISASLGIASVVADKGYTPSDLIEMADSGLYQAKNQGRNRCVAVGGARKQST